MVVLTLVIEEGDKKTATILSSCNHCDLIIEV
jgi:hypothetical protein